MNQGRRLLICVGCVGIGAACAAPLSTQRSPMHLRVIELSNGTERELVLTIVPTADQRLQAPTTFTGRFEPGERKTLYLYHGLRYQIDVLEPDGTPVSRGIFHVDHDIGLAFGGDSLEPATAIAVQLGPPVVISPDSRRGYVPVGVDSPTWPVAADTIGADGRRPGSARGSATGRRGERP